LETAIKAYKLLEESVESMSPGKNSKNRRFQGGSFIKFFFKKKIRKLESWPGFGFFSWL
jgi:hypothetical protein